MPSPKRSGRCARDWIVYAKPPFGSPEHVLAYLGRYTHRVAIANSRLVSAEDERDLPLARLPAWQRPRLMTSSARVHPPLPAPQPARRLPPHPPLWLPRQWLPPGPARHHPPACWPAAPPQPPMTSAPLHAANSRLRSDRLPLLWRHPAHHRHIAARRQANGPVHRPIHHEHASFPKHHLAASRQAVDGRNDDLCRPPRGQTTRTTKATAQATDAPRSAPPSTQLSPRQSLRVIPRSANATAQVGDHKSHRPRRVSGFAQSGFNEVAHSAKPASPPRDLTEPSRFPRG